MWVPSWIGKRRRAGIQASRERLSEALEDARTDGPVSGSDPAESVVLSAVLQKQLKHLADNTSAVLKSALRERIRVRLSKLKDQSAQLEATLSETRMWRDRAEVLESLAVLEETFGRTNEPGSFRPVEFTEASARARAIAADATVPRNLARQYLERWHPRLVTRSQTRTKT